MMFYLQQLGLRKRGVNLSCISEVVEKAGGTIAGFGQYGRKGAKHIVQRPGSTPGSTTD
jgi:hypothetical protein